MKERTASRAAYVLNRALVSLALVAFALLGSLCQDTQKRDGGDRSDASTGGRKPSDASKDVGPDASRSTEKRADSASNAGNKSAVDQPKDAGDGRRDGRSDGRPDSQEPSKGASDAGKNDASKPSGTESKSSTDPAKADKSRRTDAKDAGGTGRTDPSSTGKTDVMRPADNDTVNPDVRGKDKKKLEILPDEKSDGYVSDSTYQVFITVFAGSESEAVKMGRVEAARKTMNLILTSDQGPRRITEDGRRELKRFIETNGEVVKIVRESGDSWSVVFRVKKDGLREHLKRIK